MNKRFDLFQNILQVEQSWEKGFFSNSYISIDMEELQNILETKLNIKVDIYYKAICRGK